jgi:hypothetical protein
VIDLAADFRLRDAALYPEWYDEPHTAPGLLVDFAYGLPELYRRSIVGAPLIAVPGCYPTATSLALAPFVWGGHVEPSGLVVDAASGVSGAGRPPKPHTTFCAVDEDYCEVVSWISQLDAHLNCRKQSDLSVDADAGVSSYRSEILEAGVDKWGAEVLNTVWVRRNFHFLDHAIQGFHGGIALSR